MRRLACAALLLFLSATLGSQAKSLPDLKGRSIRAVAGTTYPPLSFIDSRTGKPAGMDFDLLAEIARRLNGKLVWSTAPGNELLRTVHDGRGDVGANGITITENRKELVDFSDPYLVSEQRMLTRGQETRFSSAAQLGAGSGLLIGAQAGAAGFYAAAYNVLDGDEKNARIKVFDSAALAVKALLAGGVDCVLAEGAAARAYVAASAGRLKLVGEPLAREPLGLALTPGSELTAAVNAAIRSMKDDGTLDRLATRWFYQVP